MKELNGLGELKRLYVKATFRRVFSPHFVYAYHVTGNESGWINYVSYESHTIDGDDYDVWLEISKRPCFYEANIWEDCFCFTDDKERLEKEGYKVKRYTALRLTRYEARKLGKGGGRK